MISINQKTIAKSISFKGIGLHSGKICNVKLVPAKEDHGIIFKRVDLRIKNLIKANYTNVSSANLCTTLMNDNGAKVSTVEHLLASLYIKGIDNLIIEIDNEEIPILDGSSKDFIKLLDEVDTVDQSKKRKYLRILDKIELEDGDKKISIEPHKTFEVDFELNYENKIIGSQKNIVNFFNDDLEDIIQSRTFCLYNDIEKIKKIGLAKGGSLDNAVVVNEKKILNEGGLRNEKEFVNHKILDLAGDFVLSEYNIIGKVICYKGGHELSNLFLRELLNKNKDKFSIVEFEEKKEKRVNHKNYPTRIAVNA
tara:strand:- start:882 stop:1808 length:927 start_codon:yes stop_codon:yes gene_type:complete